MLTDKEEIKFLKEQYNIVFLEIGWRSIWGFWELIWIFQVFILMFSFDFRYMKLAIFPLSAISVLLFVDQIIQLNKSIIDNMFLCLNLLQGIIITHEGLHYNEYKFHETWLIYYVFLVLSLYIRPSKFNIIFKISFLFSKVNIICFFSLSHFFIIFLQVIALIFE